jgi:hypothetical protein
VCSCKKDSTSSSTPAPSPPTLKIGQYYQGGIIAYLDPTGQHGFIASTEDLGTTGVTYKWSLHMGLIVGCTATNIGTGKANTQLMIDNDAYIGLKLKNLDFNGYKDWYIPSREELKQLYRQRVDIGGFDNTGAYWSSTEMSGSTALGLNFKTGNVTEYDKTEFENVRPIRSF